MAGQYMVAWEDERRALACGMERRHARAIPKEARRAHACRARRGGEGARRGGDMHACRAPSTQPGHPAMVRVLQPQPKSQCTLQPLSAPPLPSPFLTHLEDAARDDDGVDDDGKAWGG